jgi:four helix bundle protein
LNFDFQQDPMTPQTLEDRLVDFAVAVVGIVESLPDSKAGNHIANQLIRSGTSPAPNYGEARSAESRKDFIHKMKISLKELRETMIWLKIIARKRFGSVSGIQAVMAECDELIAIFVSSTKTADEKGSYIKNQNSSIINRQSTRVASNSSLPEPDGRLKRDGIV